MTTLAITGASGFIGRDLLTLALERGYRVKALMHRNAPDERAAALSNVEGVEFVQGDVTDIISVERFVSGADVVIHLAGVAHTRLVTEEDRDSARAVNVGGSRNLLNAAARLGVRRVVLASSANVYKGQCGVGINENATLAAENLYAETKIELERLANSVPRARAVAAVIGAAKSTGLEIVIGRPSLTYGANVRFNLHKLMRAIDHGFYFHVGLREVIRSFCSVHNAASAFLHLAEKGVSGEAYNIADRDPMLLGNFVNDLAMRMNRRLPVHVPYPLVWSGAAAFSILKLVGREGPISFDSLKKLTAPFSLSTGKLAATGFRWPDSGERARQQMVEAYLAGKS
ncbi:MAG TPA: NAD-dependent epimerase/dehydratase family protein [Clostridia bacterium]|nr:NAD-dependent epimerase/dehydratase family protein [Clostridia bacterium]